MNGGGSPYFLIGKGKRGELIRSRRKKGEYTRLLILMGIGGKRFTIRTVGIRKPATAEEGKKLDSEGHRRIHASGG